MRNRKKQEKTRKKKRKQKWFTVGGVVVVRRRRALRSSGGFLQRSEMCRNLMKELLNGALIIVDVPLKFLWKFLISFECKTKEKNDEKKRN